MTRPITNAEFLTAIFGTHINPDREPRLFAWVCTHDSTLGDGDKANWSGRVWDGACVCPSAAENTYFSIALLKQTTPPGAELQTLARKKSHFACLPCVMLDDVGTKADSELPADPSWLIETSPGNYQAGYIFETPIESASDADIFIKALAVAGRLTDAGGQALVRYARLPVGFNLKQKYRNEAGEPFAHRLAEWHPERRYDWRDLAERLGLDLEIHKPARSRKHRGTKSTPEGHDGAFIPRAATNPVLDALRARELYKKPLGNGGHEITCPWVSEHTDQVDSGTAYWEPDDSFMRGGFKCQHGHCAERHIGALLTWLDVNDQEARHKPTFRTAGGTLHIMVNNAERVMAETGRYFQQGGAIVTVTTPPGGTTAAHHIRKEALPYLLTGIANWLRHDVRAERWLPIDAPTRVCAGLFDAPEFRHLPPLNAIARQPYLRPDGSVATNSGYDMATGTFGAFDPRAFNILNDPSETDIKVALDRIMGLVSETSFASPADRSMALALFLTAACRPSLEVAPGFLLNAHAPGTGKSYVQDLAALFATDGDVASATLKANDDEMEKSILATLLRSPAVLRFDESQGDVVPIKFLVSALSSEHVQGRILGQSKVIAPSTRTLVMFAGNNIQPVRDMVRRVLVCNLDAKIEQPESREFADDPLSRLREHRPEYVSDALTIIRAHIIANPARTPCRALNVFPRWDNWVRQAVLWLGLADPCESMFTVAQNDPSTERLAGLLEVWDECFGDAPKAARDVIKRAETSHGLHAALMDIAGKSGAIEATKFGYWLKSNEGKVLGGRRLERYTEGNFPYARYVLRKLPNFQTGQQPPKTPKSPKDSGDMEFRGFRTFRSSKPERGNLSELHQRKTVLGDRI
jgi:hypothetical protein